MSAPHPARPTGRWAAILGLFTLGLLGVVAAATWLGVEPLGPGVLEAGSPGRVLLFEVRLPRVLLGVLVGAALGVSGATLQGVLRNPLADPYILGVSGGAALGSTLVLTAAHLAALTSVTDGGTGVLGAVAALPVSVAAAAGALLAVFVTWAVARSAGAAHPHSLLLAGVVLNAFAGSVILFLRTVVTEFQAQQLLYWLMGVLGHPGWPELAVSAALVALGSGVLFAASARLNVLSLGEIDARALGIETGRLRLLLVVASALVVGVAVSLAGLVGFVGLIVPHLLRLALGPDHRLLLPASALGGAAFLVGCDLLARLTFLVAGTEPPVGAITALVGAPFFLVLLRRGGRP